MVSESVSYNKRHSAFWLPSPCTRFLEEGVGPATSEPNRSKMFYGGGENGTVRALVLMDGYG